MIRRWRWSHILHTGNHDGIWEFGLAFLETGLAGCLFPSIALVYLSATCPWQRNGKKVQMTCGRNSPAV